MKEQNQFLMRIRPFSGRGLTEEIQTAKTNHLNQFASIRR
jgi:hypothetical protein